MLFYTGRARDIGRKRERREREKKKDRIKKLVQYLCMFYYNGRIEKGRECQKKERERWIRKRSREREVREKKQ